MFKRLIFILFLATNCFSGDFKKLSEIEKERERCYYIVELADSGSLKNWESLRSIFDLGFEKSETREGHRIVAHLVNQNIIPNNPKDKEGRLIATASFGWYVVFDVDLQGNVRKFHLSNSHK
jgi:hypothetical protein